MIQKIIEFRVSGKFAHFKKFYTNASSLSYLIPPRTVVMGMVASVLELERDSYYESFNNIEISVSIPEGLKIRKQIHSINNLHIGYYKLLTGRKGKFQHSQNKVELLMYPLKGNIIYNIFLGGHSDNEVLCRFESKLRNKNFGYGIYFGQRQFRVFAELVSVYESSEIQFIEESNFLDSACSEENFIEFELQEEISLIKEQMPHHFKQILERGKQSREPVSMKNVYFEKEGRRLHGKFRDCYKIGDKIISFL